MSFSFIFSLYHLFIYRYFTNNGAGNAKCCSSHNCHGCVDEGMCNSVDAGDETGAAHQCTWAGEPLLSSHGALVSEGRPASQSSFNSPKEPASRAVDGNVDGNWYGKSCTHTKHEAAWWQVDLGSMISIDHVDIYHRTDCCQ